MLETKRSLERPRIFNTRTLPINESDQFFQLEMHLSSLESLGSQLTRSTFIVPKTIPRILVFLTDRSAMKGPHLKRTASLITVPPASGKFFVFKASGECNARQTFHTKKYRLKGGA